MTARPLPPGHTRAASPQPGKRRIVGRTGDPECDAEAARFVANGYGGLMPAAAADQPGAGGEADGKATHVVDRDGNVWFLCPEYDGGMATRATAIGPISAGIVALEAESGPLLPFDPIAYRRTYPRTEAGR